MSQLASFTGLPLELYPEIVKYLGTESTKSLRLAYPIPIIIAATRPVLFETLVLRLGNHRHSGSILNRLCSCLVNPNNEVDLTSNRILKHVRDLVVDTRYPFIVDDELISTRPEWRVSDRGLTLADFATDVPEDEASTFLNLFKKVFRTVSGRLKSLRWQTSDFLNLNMYREIARILCEPATGRNYELSVSHTFSYSSILIPYLELLSHCDRLEILGNYYGKSTSPDEEDVSSISDLIKRCEALQSFGFIFEEWMDDEHLDILWGAIGQVETLEELKIQTVESIMSPNPVSIRSENLKHLALLCFEVSSSFRPELDSTVVFLNSLISKGVQGLTKIVIGPMMYTPSMQKLILQQRALTDLRIHIGYMEEALSLCGIVIPAVAKTLRCFRITSSHGGLPQGWSPTATYTRALLQCKKLEEVSVPFIERDWRGTGIGSVINSFPTMIDELARNCPRLVRIYTNDIISDYNVAMSILNVLKDFTFTNNIFRGRELEIVTRRYSSCEWGSRKWEVFPHKGDKENMVGVFDYYIYIWRLGEQVLDSEDGKLYMYKFQRVEDKCWLRNDCWEDD